MRVSDVTTQFPDKVAIQALIDELKAYADNIATGDIDLSDYVTKSELQAKLDALDINIDLSSYATKEELNTAINSIDLSAYALKTDIPSLEGYVTETELNAKGYLTEHQDLSNYALKTEIPSLNGYATTEYVDNAISNIPATDLSNYYTKDETYNKTEVDTLIANSGGSSGGSSSGGGASDVYSTKEVAIGTWIDGKTLYRKVIDILAVTTQSTSNGLYFYMYTDKSLIANEFTNVRIILRNSTVTVTSSQVTAEVSGTTVAALSEKINTYIVKKALHSNVIKGKDGTTIQVFVGQGYTNINKLYLVLEYTKA